MNEFCTAPSDEHLLSLYNDMARQNPSFSGYERNGHKGTYYWEWEPSRLIGRDDGLIIDEMRWFTNAQERFVSDDNFYYYHREARALGKLGQAGLQPALAASGIRIEDVKDATDNSTLFVSYPCTEKFVDLANSRHNTNDPEMYRPPIRFATFEGDHYSAEHFLHHLAQEREVLISNQDYHARHDILVHAVAWLALSPGIVGAIHNKAQEIDAMPRSDDRTLAMGNFMRNADFGVSRTPLAGILAQSQSERNVSSSPYTDSLSELTGKEESDIAEELRMHVAHISQQK